MSDNDGASGNRESRLENFAAELTSVACPLALRHGIKGSWINLELSLWKALAATVKKWARQRPTAGEPHELKAWRDGLLEDLTESAFYVAMSHGIMGSFLECAAGPLSGLPFGNQKAQPAPAFSPVRVGSALARGSGLGPAIKGVSRP